MLAITEITGCILERSTSNHRNSSHARDGDAPNLLLQYWNFCYLVPYVVELHSYGRVCWHSGVLVVSRIVMVLCVRWWDKIDRRRRRSVPSSLRYLKDQINGMKDERTGTVNIWNVKWINLFRSILGRSFVDFFRIYGVSRHTVNQYDCLSGV